MPLPTPYIICPVQYSKQAVQYTAPADSLFFLCVSRCVKKNKLFLNMQVNGNGCEDSLSRYPVVSARTPGANPAANTAPYTLPGTPTLLEEHSTIKSESAACMHF